jgi:Domain of unknown function (DUF4919)
MMTTMMKRWLWVFFLVLVTLSSQSRAAETRYDVLLAKVKSGDLAVDFREMRLAYADSDRFNPYGGGLGARDAMFTAMAAKDYPSALEKAGQVMQANYVDIDAHMIASMANEHLGNQEKADFHRTMVRGLLKSILDHGDGRTPETAFTVISVDEEYVLLYVLGLNKSQQAMLEQNGHNYDKFTISDPKTGTQYDLFFNIDIPFRWLQNSLKKG